MTPEEALTCCKEYNKEKHYFPRHLYWGVVEGRHVIQPVLKKGFILDELGPYYYYVTEDQKVNKYTYEERWDMLFYLSEKYAGKLDIPELPNPIEYYEKTMRWFFRSETCCFRSPFYFYNIHHAHKTKDLERYLYHDIAGKYRRNTPVLDVLVLIAKRYHIPVSSLRINLKLNIENYLECLDQCQRAYQHCNEQPGNSPLPQNYVKGFAQKVNRRIETIRELMQLR